MEEDIIKEAIDRIRGLPTLSRIRKELTENFQLRIEEEGLEEDLERMIEEGVIEERVTTIKRTEFKGYKIVEEGAGEKQEEEEEKTEAEEIIDEVFS